MESDNDNSIELVPLEQIKTDEIRDNYPSLDKTEVLRKFVEVKNKWIKALPEKSSPIELLRLAMRNFELSDEIFYKKTGAKDIDRKCKIALYEVLSIYQWFTVNSMLQEIDPDDELNYFIVFNKIYEMIYYARNMVESSYRMRMPIDPDYDSSMNDDMGITRFAPKDLSKLSSYQLLELYILEMLYQHGYTILITDMMTI
jgi:hypothetical protein